MRRCKLHLFCPLADELSSRIAIKADYPKSSAIFCIKMNSSQAARDALRDIEREVNVMWQEQPTLSAQVQRLRACFDIHLETEGLVNKEKIFFHAVKGRSRAKPYKYLPLANGIFVHR